MNRHLNRSRYLQLDLDDMVTKTGTPVEVVIKVTGHQVFLHPYTDFVFQKKGGKKKIIHCSKLKFTSEEKKGNGWCATKADEKGKGASS